MCTTRWSVAVLGIAVLAVIAVPAFAQGEPDFADQVSNECKDFKATHDKKPDAEVNAQIDKLLALYKDEKADEKVKKEIVQTIGLATRVKSDEVALHALKALGETDEDALKSLDPVLKLALKAKPPKVDVYEACFAGMGKIASPKSVGNLTDYLKHKDYDVIAQAANALQGFKGAPGAVRKDIFEELLKTSEGLYSSANANPTAEPARKWRVIGTAMMDAMKAVSHEELSDPTAARKWFNEVKKQNWDKIGEGADVSPPK